MAVWRYVPKVVRDRYERRFGIKPPGYRGTGPVHWFEAWHPDEAPCCKCGAVTDRWVIGICAIKRTGYESYWSGTSDLGSRRPLPESLPLPEKMRPDKRLAFCAETAYAFCWPCERRAAIAVLERRQQNAAIDERVRAGEARYLAELVTEERREANTAGGSRLRHGPVGRSCSRDPDEGRERAEGKVAPPRLSPTNSQESL